MIRFEYLHIFGFYTDFADRMPYAACTAVNGILYNNITHFDISHKAKKQAVLLFPVGFINYGHV